MSDPSENGLSNVTEGMPSALSVEVVDFEALEGVPCPCGTARRGLMHSATVPYSLHITEISTEARIHYHKTITETYLFLECGPNAGMDIDGNFIVVKPQMAVVIPPGTRHRALGEMKVAIIASPKFDPADEHFD